MVPYEGLFRPLTQSSAFTGHGYTPGQTGRQEIMDLGRQRSAAGSRLLITYLVVSLVPPPPVGGACRAVGLPPGGGRGGGRCGWRLDHGASPRRGLRLPCSPR